MSKVKLPKGEVEPYTGDMNLRIKENFIYVVVLAMNLVQLNISIVITPSPMNFEAKMGFFC